METLQILGFAAAFCTTVSFIPQVMQILKTGNVDGISVGMYSTFTVGIALWFSYGVIMGDVPIIAANFITLILALAVLVLTLVKRYRVAQSSSQSL